MFCHLSKRLFINNHKEQTLQDNITTNQELEDKPVLRILYQDEYMVAVDKPAGLFVHRSFMDKDEIYFALQLVRDQIGKYVYPVHRLDRPTSGVLLFALTKEVATLLSQAFANKSSEHESDNDYNENDSEMVLQESSTLGSVDKQSFTDLSMRKTYFALVRGHLGGSLEIADKEGIPTSASFSSGLIDYPLKEKLDKIGDKHVNRYKAAQSAQSFYQVVAQASLPVAVGKFNSVRYSLVKVMPITGRRHQIRRHLAHLRNPIIGDINYGDNKQNPFFNEYFGFKRLMLQAKSLEFIHPVTGTDIKISSSLDEQWRGVLKKLNWQEELFL